VNLFAKIAGSSLYDKAVTRQLDASLDGGNPFEGRRSERVFTSLVILGNVINSNDGKGANR
jgi:hypothetical protein